MSMKQCTQCGDMKPQDQFRNYYGKRTGTYNQCRDCERINSRYKYLQAKGAGTQSAAEADEVSKIEALWTAQRLLGLKPPRVGSGRSKPLDLGLDDKLARYTKSAEQSLLQPCGPEHSATARAELHKWLVEPLTEEPDYYLDNIYEELKRTYRPILRIDHETMLPVHDETYKTILDQILSRFYDYEDAYDN